MHPRRPRGRSWGGREIGTNGKDGGRGGGERALFSPSPFLPRPLPLSRRFRSSHDLPLGSPRMKAMPSCNHMGHNPRFWHSQTTIGLGHNGSWAQALSHDSFNENNDFIKQRRSNHCCWHMTIAIIVTNLTSSKQNWMRGWEWRNTSR